MQLKPGGHLGIKFLACFILGSLFRGGYQPHNSADITIIVAFAGVRPGSEATKGTGRGGGSGGCGWSTSPGNPGGIVRSGGRGRSETDVGTSTAGCCWTSTSASRASVGLDRGLRESRGAPAAIPPGSRSELLRRPAWPRCGLGAVRSTLRWRTEGGGGGAENWDEPERSGEGMCRAAVNQATIITRINKNKTQSHVTIGSQRIRHRSENTKHPHAILAFRLFF